MHRQSFLAIVQLALVLAELWGAFPAVAQILPTLPQATVDTTMPAVNGNTYAVYAGDDLQAAIDEAAAANPNLNHLIILQAGATFQGPFTLPARAAGTGWVIVRSSAIASLPPEGTRVHPSDVPNMPTIVSTGSLAVAVDTDPGAHHFRLIGIEFRPAADTFTTGLIRLGSASETDVNQLPSHLVFDRCYIHGDPAQGGRRGISMNSRSTAVIDSHLSDWKDSKSDSQTLWGSNGPGPFKLVNNYLEAAAENIMFGGADPAISNLVPSDIEMRHNYFFKPLAWRGSRWVIKNLLEIKNGQRILIEGNIFENIWTADQAGRAIVFKSTNQSRGCNWCTASDITFRYNLVRNASGGFSVGSEGGTFVEPQRILMEHNLWDNIDTNEFGSGAGYFAALTDGADLTIVHNTALLTNGTYVILADVENILGLMFTDNLLPHSSSGVDSGGTSIGTDTLTTVFPGHTFLKNVMWSPPAGIDETDYPAGNYLPPSVTSVQFVNFNNGEDGDYHLALSSPYRNAGTDGKDIGGDIDAINAAIVGVIQGTWTSDSSPPTTPTNLTATAASSSQINLSWTAATDDVGIAGYQVYRDGSQIATTASTTYADSGLLPSTAYTYVVVAYDGAGNVSAQSTAASATTLADTTPPTVPQNLKATAVSSSQINLSWKPSTDNIGVTGYQVLRCQGVGCTTFTQVGTASGTTYTDTGLLALSSYSYRVRATDAAGNLSANSNTASAKTKR